MRYQRVKVESATYFFTLVTENKRSIFEGWRQVALLDAAIAKVRESHPFDIMAHVVLPDHVHTIWKLPHPDAHCFTSCWSDQGSIHACLVA